MELQQRTVIAMQEVFGVGTDEGRFACRAMVAAISALATHELAGGESGDVRSCGSH
jgi:hypothetical protein